MKKNGNKAQDATRQPSPKERQQDNNIDTGQEGTEGTREEPKHKKNPVGIILATDKGEWRDLESNSGLTGPRYERKRPNYGRWPLKEDPAGEWPGHSKGLEDSTESAKPTNNKKEQHYTYDGSETADMPTATAETK